MATITMNAFINHLASILKKTTGRLALAATIAGSVAASTAQARPHGHVQLHVNPHFIVRPAIVCEGRVWVDAQPGEPQAGPTSGPRCRFVPAGRCVAEPVRTLCPRVVPVCMTEEIAAARQILASDSHAAAEAEDAVLERMASESAYAKAVAEKESASRAIRDGDSDAAQQLLAATQALSDLKRNALATDAAVLAARAAVEADDAALAVLLQDQQAFIATATAGNSTRNACAALGTRHG